MVFGLIVSLSTSTFHIYIFHHYTLFFTPATSKAHIDPHPTCNNNILVIIKQIYIYTFFTATFVDFREPLAFFPSQKSFALWFAASMPR